MLGLKGGRGGVCISLPSIPDNGAREGKFMEELDLVVLTHDISEYGLI
jgi:hypothetical protein